MIGICCLLWSGAALDVLTDGSAPPRAAVAEREDDDCVATDEGVNRVAASLHHHHLPKMESFGVVQYDPDERLVIRTPASGSSDGGTTLHGQRERNSTELSDAEFHGLLAHGRRRAALEVLSELAPPVELEDLAAQVAAQESGGFGPTDEQEASVAIALHHAHLPKMDQLGIIEYDAEAARVESGPQ